MKYIPSAVRDAVAAESELSKIYLRPTRILWHNDAVTGAEQLLTQAPLQALVGESGAPLPAITLLPGGAVLIDFGREICGGIKLFTRAVRDIADGKKAPMCRLRLRFGESAGEAMAELFEKGTTNDHNPRDFSVPVGLLSMPELGDTGFRFVRIDNVDERELILSGVCAYAYFRDIEYVGSFRSSDPLLNRIYDTAAYTLHLCMQEYLWDGIKRDRLVWIGDSYPEVSALCAVFGNNDVVKKSLDLVRDHTAPDRFANGIFTYSAWWVLSHYRFYLQNGDRRYLAEQRTRLIETVRQMADYIDENGSLDAKGIWAFFDWPSNGVTENGEAIRNVGVHAVLKMMYDAAAFLFDELKESAFAGFCRDLSKKLLSAPLPDCGYKPISAACVLAGLRDAKRETERVLSHGGATGISTFLGMFVFAAESEAGDTALALGNIRELYGKMLSLGATSFWEDFDPAWCKGAGTIDELTPKGLEDIHGDRGAACYTGFRHSLCHGWSSGVCAYLAEYLLGVRILKPGCREIELVPHPGGLSRIEGSYPTPFGALHIVHEKTGDGSYRTTFDAPEQVKVTLRPAKD